MSEEKRATNAFPIVSLPTPPPPVTAATEIVRIPGAKRMPPPPLPRRHAVIVHHHRHKSVAVMVMTAFILFVALVLAVTPLGASASAAAQGAYHATANAAAEAQHNPAPFPTPARGTPSPLGDSPAAAGQPGGDTTPHASGVHAFVCALLPWARYASSNTTDAAGHSWRTSVILAQWAIEQGWRTPGYTGYNLGNVSAIAGFPSVGGIPVVGSPGRFAFGANLTQGVQEYLIFTANTHYYGGVNAAYSGGADAQAVALGRSPWDAAHYNPGGGPGTLLVSVMRSNNLYRFDDPNVGC